MARVRLTTIAVALCAALGMAVPSLAAASSISGTVTAEGGGPIQGIEVCSRANPYTFEDTCVETNAGGAYTIPGLPGGSYYVAFFPHRNHLNYVYESYSNKLAFLGDGDIVSIGPGQNLTGIDAQLEVGGVVTGTATDAGSLGPAAGVWVCVDPIGLIPFGICRQTGADGKYDINGVPTGSYRVSFDGENEANYLRRYFDESETSAGATPVEVIAGNTYSGIDAALQPGAQILGRVTEMGTGLPREDVFVCIYEGPPGEEQKACDWTDAAGNYAIRSIPAGTYIVAFQPERYPSGLFADQWWQGVATMAEATPIPLVPPDTRTGIDGQVRPLFRSNPRPIQVSFVPRPKPKPRKCKKGFHKKKVKGKKRCVRKHKRHGKKAGKGVRKGGKSRASR